jgi:hypothetical protein
MNAKDAKCEIAWTKIAGIGKQNRTTDGAD